MIEIAASGASDRDASVIADELLGSLQPQWTSESADVAILFVSPEFNGSLDVISDRVKQASRAAHVIGCSGESVIGPQREYDKEPAASLWLGRFPQSRVSAFHITQSALENAQNPDDWRALLNRESNDGSAMLLGDPFSINVKSLLEGLNQHLPGFRLFGGMASGSMAPGEATLTLDGELIDEGAVGISFEGGLRIETVISQGCRPIGSPYVITAGEKNMIAGLGGRKPLELVKEIYHSLPDADRELMGHGLFVGRVIDEYKSEFVRGDFLIRNIMGADNDTGSIAVMDHVQVGSTIQFHIRDAATADEDIRAMLDPFTGQAPKGALLFNCNGRGLRMYSDPDHDLGVIQSSLGAHPLTGFFAAGELGPVGGENFIHGHTASLALFYEQ